MTVNLVYTSFLVLIIILFIVSLYFLSSLAYKKFNRKKIEEKTQKIFKDFERILGGDKEDFSLEIKNLKNSFSNGRDIKSFHLAYVKYVGKYGYSQELKELLNKVVDYEKIMKGKIMKKTYRKSYTLYLISEFNLSGEEVGRIAFDALGDDSIYVRNNALNAIRNQGKVEAMLETMDKMNICKKYYNSRLLIDFLDNFKGDKKKLDDEILKRIDSYKNRFKSLIVEHLINMENDDKKTRDKILDFLENSKDNEILIKSTRYFYRIGDERALKYILENISSGSWSLRASSATAISKYPREEVILKLKETLGDPNYFVRRNSAMSLAKIEEKEDLFLEAYYNEDPFARDILTYTIESSGIKGFEDFKKRRKVEDDLEKNKLGSKGKWGLEWE